MSGVTTPGRTARRGTYARAATTVAPPIHHQRLPIALSGRGAACRPRGTVTVGDVVMKEDRKVAG